MKASQLHPTWFVQYTLTRPKNTGDDWISTHLLVDPTQVQINSHTIRFRQLSYRQVEYEQADIC